MTHSLVNTWRDLSDLQQAYFNAASNGRKSFVFHNATLSTYAEATEAFMHDLGGAR